MDAYISAIRLYDSLQTIYIVLLKHYPTGAVNSKVLFYDNLKKEFSDNDFDFNLYALYDLDKGKLIPTNLKTELNITAPEIEITDYNKDGINDYKFTRLYHNGTTNAIETTVLKVSDGKVETLDFQQKWIEYGAESL